MASYRLYCLDAGGHIGLADWIEAETDEDAITQAHWMKRTAVRCEVWQGTRLVAVVGAQALASSRLTA